MLSNAVVSTFTIHIKILWKLVICKNNSLLNEYGLLDEII